MNSREKIVQEAFINDEEAVIRRLKKVYEKALEDINKTSKDLQTEIEGLNFLYDSIEDEEEKKKLKSMQQSKVYQKQYQDAMKKQISGILDTMQVEEFKTVSGYLNQCYEQGFLGTMYNLQGQGIPLVFPMDQEAIVRAVQLESKISKGLYERLGEDVGLLKRKITATISRGVSTGMRYEQIAQQLAGYTNIGFNNAVRIARTEGHRIQVQSSMDACYKAKEKGADVVKQWDSTLDGKTRDSHSQVDGEVRELDEKFSNGLRYPSDPHGKASEVINCRCALLQRARWALGDEFTKVDGFSDELKQFENQEAYDDFKKDYFSKENKVYMKYVDQMEKKYGRNDMLSKMSNQEFNHLKKLEKERPTFEGMYQGQNVIKIKAKDFEGFKEEYLNAVDEIQTIDSINSKGQKVLADAYEKHRIKNNMTSVPYDELGDSASDIISVDYGKMSVESAKAFDNTINKLVNEYDTPIQKIRTMTREEFMSNGDAFAYVSHNYTVDSAELVINPTKCKDIDKMKERIKELSGYGYCVKIPDEVVEQYIATHEFAHTLINLEQPLKKKTNWLNADYEKIKKARKEINAVYDEYMEEVERLTKAREEAEFLALTEVIDENWLEAEKAIDALDAVKLSDYSLESADEFMAEAFVNEKIGTSSNKYSKKVVDILDKYFKG